MIGEAIQQITSKVEELLKKQAKPGLKMDALAAERLAVWQTQVRQTLKKLLFFFPIFFFYFIFLDISQHLQPRRTELIPPRGLRSV